MRNINNVKKNQLDVMASKQALETAENEISLQVTSAFMDVLFNREQLKVAQSQLEITREQTERTRKLYNAGSVAQGELLNIEAQLAQEEVNKINRENNLNLAVLSLKQLLRIPSSEPFEIVSPETFDADQLQMPNQSQSIIETALNNYPSIQQRETEVESAEMQISLAKGMLSPTISLSGGLATGYSGLRTEVVSVQPGSPREIGYVSGSNQPVLTQTFNQNLRDVPFFDQLDNNLNRNVGFSMSIPIFNNFSTLTSINRAEIQRDMAQTRLKQEKQTVTQDIERAYADAMASFKRYQASKKSVQSLETAFDYSEKRFDVGMINAVDYNTAKNNLTQAKSDLLRAKYEYLFRLKVLDFYQGNQIAFE
jgi:outer membrane protein